MSSPTSVTLVVTFGPTTSEQLSRVLQLARRFGVSLVLEDDQYVATFELERDPAVFAGAAQLLQRIGGWRSSVVEVDGEPERMTVVEAMAWCARRYLRAGGCTYEYWNHVPDRCRSCPLFDADRAKDQMAAHRAGMPWVAPIPDHIPDEWDDK